MKSLTLAAAVCLLLAGMARTEAQASAPKPHFAYFTWLLPSSHGSLNSLALRRVALPLQTASGTGTPTAAPAATATTAATATSGTSYPDPVTILQNMYNVSGLLQTAHFTQSAHQSGAPTLDFKGVGDATCTGPALKAKVTAKVTVPGTNQSQSKSFNVIQVKSKYYLKAKSTKNKWATSTAKKTQVFGINVENPLPCPNSTSSSGSGSGSSGTSDQIKDLVNVGPQKYHNVTVWHIHAVDVQTDTSGATTEYPIDWYVDQAHGLPVGYVFSFNDTVNNVTGSFTTIMSKFGEKLSIKAPKIGATTP